MRFNPKARLDTRRVRDAGRGRRRRAAAAACGIPIPGGIAAGGGIGGLIIIVLIVVLTQCLGGGSGGGAGGGGSTTSRMPSDTGRYDDCETGEDANDDADCARVAVENSLYDYWADTLPAQTGVEFTPSRRSRPSPAAVDTGCGQATSAVGPFYCPPDETIYLDTTFFDEVLERQLGGPGGGFVEPYVLAHEYGHHIQNLLGTMGQVQTQQGPKSDAVRLELQADCYAGMWAQGATHHRGRGRRGADLRAHRAGHPARRSTAAEAVGDDRIQEQTGGRVDPEERGPTARRRSGCSGS